MEYTLRETIAISLGVASKVLILVLMEYTLRADKAIENYNTVFEVLILVLMEYTLRGAWNHVSGARQLS